MMGREEANFVFDGLVAQMAIHFEPSASAKSSPLIQYDPEDEIVVQVWDDAGHLIHSNSELQIPQQRSSDFVSLTIDGTPWRVFTLQGDGRTVQISQRQEVRDEVAQHLALSAALPIFAALPIVWLLVALALGRLFQHLDETSEKILARSLKTTKALPLDGMPEEMKPFIKAMNQLLARQTAAIVQQRHFVSDAAHELRTPLTALQILTDTLSERVNRTSEAVEGELIPELHQAVRRARSLADQLLKLAEVETGPEGASSSTADLREMLLEVIAGLVPAASSRNIDFVVDAETTATILVSSVDLTTLLSVLVDNAVRYSPANSSIDARLNISESKAFVEIRDRGSGIAADALPRIYDRFFRAAPNDIEGAGLGLSIAKAVADRYSFALSIENRISGGVIARVTFPLASPASSSDLRDRHISR
ncbi:MAG: sensor histidine kinase N-terminal domain-containing protein [Proteobacteria bacterium]|nr:sensor histidine kinase N-terminal domain-containing protein [Pseudomonadota bacterium]